MATLPALLTDDEVRTTYFRVPELGLALAFGTNFLNRFRRMRAVIEQGGGALYAIGWPDGTTITYHVIDGSDPIDPENLLTIYRDASLVMRSHMVKRPA